MNAQTGAPQGLPKPEFVHAVGKALTAAGCADRARHAEILGPLATAAQRFEIVRRERVAHWLAQLGHESGGFSVLEENLNYSAKGLLDIFPVVPVRPNREDINYRRYTPELAAEHALKPERIANHVYNRRDLGNLNPGDGWRFRGRGFIQITGRTHYAAAGRVLDLDLTANPDLAADPKIAARIAGWWWWDKALNRVADRGPDGLEQITRTINGGTHGLDARRRRYDAARLALEPFPEALEV